MVSIRPEDRVALKLPAVPREIEGIYRRVPCYVLRRVVVRTACQLPCASRSAGRRALKELPSPRVMHCVYPHCEGMLSLTGPTGHCERCRLPVQRCAACDSWNRSQAIFCRTCSQRLNSREGLFTRFVVDGPTFEREPIRLRLVEPIRTLPQAYAGFLWAMGERGNLYRINPYERDGRSPEVCTRMWANPAAHAFAVRDLTRSDGSGLTEGSAVISTAERVAAWGLVSQTTRVFSDLESGEQILADARDKYQLVEASGRSAFVLIWRAGGTRLLAIDLLRREAVRYPLTGGDAGEAVCGPVLVQGRVLAWTARAILTLSGPEVERQEVPPGVELWTEPAENSAMRLPLGRPPSMAAGNSIYLPCNHYGGPALLRAQAVGSGWSFSAIPVPAEGGTMAQDDEGNPLLASRGRLLRCVGSSFRELAAEEQMSARFTAFQADDLSIYFCEGEYGIRSHDWLQVRTHAGSHRMKWSMEGSQVLKECGGFWNVSGALMAQLLVEDGRTTTEFLSWHE